MCLLAIFVWKEAAGMRRRILEQEKEAAESTASFFRERDEEVGRRMTERRTKSQSMEQLVNMLLTTSLCETPTSQLATELVHWFYLI